MKYLELSSELRLRLKRIDSPIAQAILKKRKVPDEKNYLNQIQTSKENPAFVCYNDTNKENKNGVITILEIPYIDKNNCKIKLPKSLFHQIQRVDGQKVTNPSYNSDDNYLSPTNSYPYKSVWKDEYKDKWFTFIPVMSRYPYDNIDPKIVRNSTYMEYLQSCDDYSPNNHSNLGTIKIGGVVHSLVLKKANHDLVEIKKEIYSKKITNLWNSKVKLHASVAKIAKRILHDRWLWNDSVMEDFVNKFKVAAFEETPDPNYTYKELIGEDIRWGYHVKNYLVEKGGGSQLLNSCMRHDKCQPYFDLYVDHPNNIGMASLFKDEKIAARALVWYPKGREEEPKWHDRIYGSNSKTANLLRALLKNKGYIDVYIKPTKYSIKLEKLKDGYPYYPFLDTFRVMSSDYTLHNMHDKPAYNLRHTDGRGGPPPKNHIACGRCDTIHKESLSIVLTEGSYRGRKLCPSCIVTDPVSLKQIAFGDYRTCVDVAGRTRYAYPKDVVADYNGRYILKEDAKQTLGGSYYLEDSQVVKDTDGKIYNPQEAKQFCVLHNKLYYNFDSPDVVIFKRKYVHRDNPDFVASVKNKIPF